MVVVHVVAEVVVDGGGCPGGGDTEPEREGCGKCSEYLSYTLGIFCSGRDEPSRRRDTQGHFIIKCISREMHGIQLWHSNRCLLALVQPGK